VYFTVLHLRKTSIRYTLASRKFNVERLHVNNHCVVTGFIDSATPKYNLFMKYAKVELAPPTPADIPQIRSGIQKLLTGFRTGKWKETTVKVCIWFPP